MRADDFVKILSHNFHGRDDVRIETHSVAYSKMRNGKRRSNDQIFYPFPKIVSADIKPHDEIILIRAGIHGEEIAGPLTILDHINEIIDYIHGSGLKLILYPLGNPSGFENGLRYNIDGDVGQGGNNDFLRYELSDGRIVDELLEGDDFVRWYWSSDKRLLITLPAETQLMHKLLRQDPQKQISACIDLHQDYYMNEAKPAAYHYAFGDLERYNSIVSAIERIVPLLKHHVVASGYRSGLGGESDARGFIVRHDGTLTDLFCRFGTRHCITVETIGATLLDVAKEVNLIWIFGIADILKNERNV